MKTKTLNNINAEILSSKGLSIERTEKHWSIYKLLSGNTVVNEITWKKPVGELYDAMVRDFDSFISSSQPVPSFDSTLSALPINDNVLPIKKKSFSIKSKSISSFENETSSLLYTKKNPNSSYEGFYFPEFLDSLVNRIKAKRNVLLTGPAGCLDYNEEIEINIPKDFLVYFKK